MTEKTPDLSSNERRAKVTSISAGQTYAETGEHHMERLATTFESSARRWEMIVYPSLFAFIVLASYGFYLIYSLTHDVASLARNVAVLTQSIDHMVVNMDSISTNMVSISGDLNNINGSMDTMNDSTRSMAISVDGIRNQVGSMNYNIGRPMSQMSSFMPW
jgi:uncharacterized protein YoxC